MLHYIFRRIMFMIPVVLGVTFLIFALVYALPGDPIAAMAGDRPLDASTIEVLRKQYNLDLPLWQQYAIYMGNLFTGNFGTDFYGNPVIDQILQRLPVTAQLAITAWLMKVAIGVTMGLYSGLRPARAFDRFNTLYTIIFMALPGFVVAYAMQQILGVELGWLPISGISAGFPMAYLLPALVIAVESSAGLARLTRTSVIETMTSEFIKTARAKGASPSRVLWGHAVRNSMIPVVTFLGLSLAGLLGGAVLIEAIFNLPGIGGLIAEQITQQNGPVIVGTATFLVIFFLFANLIVDIMYGVIDPRVRYE